MGPRSPILCHTCATNCATICGTCGTKFFCATFCGTYFLYFTCDPFYSSHFWIPDPLFCASKVPQNEAHEAHSLNVPQFEAHNWGSNSMDPPPQGGGSKRGIQFWSLPPPKGKREGGKGILERKKGIFNEKRIFFIFGPLKYDF